MKRYAVTCAHNPVYFVDADDKEEAEELALDLMNDEYGLTPGQAYVDAIKEVK